MYIVDSTQQLYATSPGEDAIAHYNSFTALLIAPSCIYPRAQELDSITPQIRRKRNQGDALGSQSSHGGQAAYVGNRAVI